MITVKGLKILQTADVVMYTDSFVNEELIAKAKPEAEVMKTAGMHLEEMVDIMVDRVKQVKWSHVSIQEILLCTVQPWNKLFC